jgi:hypothetical protein
MRNYVLAVIIFVTGAPSALLAQTASQTEQNRKVVTSFHELLNRGDWQQAADLFASDVRHFASRDDLGLTQQLGLLPSPPAAGVINL